MNFSRFYLTEKQFVLGSSVFPSLGHCIVYLTKKGKDYKFIKDATKASDTMIRWYMKHPEDVKGSVDPIAGGAPVVPETPKVTPAKPAKKKELPPEPKEKEVKKPVEPEKKQSKATKGSILPPVDVELNLEALQQPGGPEQNINKQTTWQKAEYTKLARNEFNQFDSSMLPTSIEDDKHFTPNFRNQYIYNHAILKQEMTSIACAKPGMWDGVMAQRHPWIVAAAISTPPCPLKKATKSLYTHAFNESLQTVIKMDKSYGPEEYAFVFRHEFGHRMNHMASGATIGAYSVNFRNGVGTDNNVVLRNSFDEKAQKRKLTSDNKKSCVEFEEIVKELEEYSDKNIDYSKEKLTRITQMFVSDKFYELYDDYVKKNLPEFDSKELRQYIDKQIWKQPSLTTDEEKFKDETALKMIKDPYNDHYIPQYPVNSVNAAVLKITIALANKDFISLSTTARMNNSGRSALTCIQDMTDSFTKGKMWKKGTFGHGAKYWRDPSHQGDEFFAHYCSTQAGNSEIEAKIFRNVFSDECAELDRICKIVGHKILKPKQG